VSGERYAIELVLAGAISLQSAVSRVCPADCSAGVVIYLAAGYQADRAAYPRVKRAGRPFSLIWLAPVGLPSGMSPSRWCALTAPFHPYQVTSLRPDTGVCFLLHFRPVPGTNGNRSTRNGGRLPPPRPVEPGLSSLGTNGLIRPFQQRPPGDLQVKTL